MNSDKIVINKFIENHPMEAVRLLERLKIEDIVLLLKEISTDHAVIIFKQLERITAAKCMETLGAEKSAAIIEKLPLQIVSVFLRQTEVEVREAIVAATSEEISVPLRRLLSYPADSAGALADPLVLSLPDDISIREAQRRILKSPEKTIYYLYVVKRDHVLSGVINLRELMLAEPAEQLTAVLHPNVARLSAELNFQAILNHPGWQEYHTLPVVEQNDIFLGAIRYETLRRIERESKKSRLPRQVVTAGNALGELYQIGISGLLRGATIPFKDLSDEK